MGKIDIKQTYKDSQFSSVQSLRHVGLFAIPWTAACQASLSITNSQFSAVQSLSCVRLFVTPWTVVCQASLSITNSWNLLKLVSIESVMPSNHLILCHPFSSHLQAFPVSGSFPVSQFFTSGGQSIELQLQHQSFQYSEMISFMTDWFGLLAVQGTLKSLLQHHSSKASVLRHSAFFMVQLSHLYMTTQTTIALPIQTFSIL